MVAADAGGEGFVFACMWLARWKCVITSGFYFGVTSGARLLLLQGLVAAFPKSKLSLTMSAVFWFVQKHKNNGGTPSWNRVSISGNQNDLFFHFFSFSFCNMGTSSAILFWRLKLTLSHHTGETDWTL